MNSLSRPDWILRAACFCLGISMSTANHRRLQTPDSIDLALMNEPDRPYKDKKTWPPDALPRPSRSPSVFISTTGMPSIAPVAAPSQTPSQGPTVSTETPTFSPTSFPSAFPTRGLVTSTGIDGDDSDSEAPTIAPIFNNPDGDDTASEAPTIAPTRRNIFNNPDGDDASDEAPTMMPSLSSGPTAIPTFAQGWEQVPYDFLFGQYDGEAFGASLSLTDDGNIVTAGAHLYNESGTSEGRFAQYDLRLNGSTPSGLIGEEGAYLGYQQVATADGSLIATIDQLTGWITLYEHTALHFSNATVIDAEVLPISAEIAMSSDGDLIAVVGEVWDNVTQQADVVIKLYGLDSDSETYIQLGETVQFNINSLFEEDDETTWGMYDIDVDDNGEFVIVSQTGQGGFPGQVRIYRIDGVQLVQVGDTFVSDSEDDFYGEDVKIVVTSDSQVVAAFSEPESDIVYVYTLDATGDQWVPLGSPILPELLEGSGSRFGLAIDLKQASNGGNLRIVIGAPFSDNRGGAMSLFEFSEGEWTLVGLPVRGQQASAFGETVSCNQDCSLVAVGAPDDCINDDICGGGVYVVRYTYLE